MKKTFIAKTAAFLLAAMLFLAFIWSRYQEPVITETQIPETQVGNSLSKATEVWFRQWADEHQGWDVPPAYRLQESDITQLVPLPDGYIELHYQTRIPFWNRWAVQNLSLIPTQTPNIFDGQLVLQWERDEGFLKIVQTMTPVQYQLQTDEFYIESQTPQSVPILPDLSSEQTCYAVDGVLYVTYDGGESSIEVPDGYESICASPNGGYDEYIPEQSRIVSRELTAFVLYSNDQTSLLYSTDAGQSWRESVVCDGGFRANTFLSKTDSFCYLTFTVDRTGGRDYYCSFRSSDLSSWERIDGPQEIMSNVSCVYWQNDNTGYYDGGAAGFWRTGDGGRSYTLYPLPQFEKVIDRIGYNPYDLLESMYENDGVLYMVIGQGDDGDYALGGKLLKGIFASDNGIDFRFIEERKDDIVAAG